MINYVGTPRAGYYQMRLVRGGPFVPIRIYQGFPRDPETGEELERGWIWRATLYETEIDIWQAWPMCSGRPISEAEHRYLTALHHHAVAHEPDMAEANPRRRIDPLTVAPPRFK